MKYNPTSSYPNKNDEPLSYHDPGIVDKTHIEEFKNKCTTDGYTIANQFADTVKTHGNFADLYNRIENNLKNIEDYYNTLADCILAEVKIDIYEDNRYALVFHIG